MAKRKNFLTERGRYVGVFPPAGGFHSGHKGYRRVLCKVSDLEHLSKENKAQRLHELWMQKSRELADAEFKANEEKKKRDNRKLWTVSRAKALWLKTMPDNDEKTKKDYKKTIDHYIKAKGNHVLNDFDVIAYAEFVTYLKTEVLYRRKPLADATVNKHTRQFRAFINWAYEAEIITQLPKLKMPKSPEKDMDTYTISDLHLIKSHIETQLAIAKASGKSGDICRMKNALRVWWLATYSIMRLGAMWALKLENIDLKRGTIRITDNDELGWVNKRKKWPIKPISKKLMAFLEEDMKSRNNKERYYLDKGNGEPWYKQNGDITRLIRKFCRDCGLPDIKALHHGFRATMITQLLLDGENLVTVQKLADHSDINTTRKYLDSRRVEQEKATNRIDELV